MDFLFERIGGIAARAQPGMAWRNEVLALCQSEKRQGKPTGDAGAILVEAARLLRAARELPTEAYCYIVAWVVENEVEPAIRGLYSREFEPGFKAIQEAYRLRANWEFRAGEEPPEYEALSREFDRRVGDLTAEGFRRHDEPILAEHYERDRLGFGRLRDAGRAALFGQAPPLVAVG